MTFNACKDIEFISNKKTFDSLFFGAISFLIIFDFMHVQ